MSNYSPEELRLMTKKMRDLVTSFYWQVIQIGCHPFIEFCGLMAKYVDICEASGISFPDASTHTGIALPLADHHLTYLAEKFDCIFGPSLKNKQTLATFLNAMEWLSDEDARLLADGGRLCVAPEKEDSRTKRDRSPTA